MNSVFEQMEKSGIIPVTTVTDAKDAPLLARALLEGGIRIAEITYRTEKASDAIAAISAECPEILPGAGTVLKIGQAKEAIASGARFIVSPGFDAEITDYCLERNVAVIPGVATASEITAAVKSGLKILKLFPAELLGGVRFVDAMSGPFPEVRFVPTGGITAENARAYLQRKNILAVGGSWIVQKEFIQEKKWEIITAEAEKALINIRHSGG